jgi:tRNA modification GTPase
MGARLARPESSRSARLNGKLDLAQAESVADLIDAATATAARAAARSLSGAFSNEINALVNALIELRMYVEATLDFPEEDIAFLRAADVHGRIAAIADAVDGVQTRAKQGALLREGLAVVLVGRPNVGKSSLLNRLAGDAVAIVTPIPGTTRDAVPSQIEIHGIPLTIVDTAGLRATDDPIETLGIGSAPGRPWRADLALVMVDSAAGGTLADSDTALLAQLPPALPRLVVHNKIDLLRLPASVDQRITLGPDGAGGTERDIFLSAKTGAGIELLQQGNTRGRRRP